MGALLPNNRESSGLILCIDQFSRWRCYGDSLHCLLSSLMGAFMRTDFFLCFSVLRVTSGPRVKLAGRKSALTTPPPPPPVVYSTDRSKAVVLVLFLLFVALWFPHCFLFFFSICVVMLELWSPSSKVAHFAFCFTSCIVVLAFWSPSTALFY